MRVKSSQDPFVVVHHSPSLNVGAADRGDWGYPPCAQLATANTPSAAGTAFLISYRASLNRFHTPTVAAPSPGPGCRVSNRPPDIRSPYLQ